MSTPPAHPLARRSGIVLFATLAGGAVIGVPGGPTHTLDPVTAAVWHNADGNVDVASLAARVGASELDVWQALDRLADAQLLAVHPAPRGGAVAVQAAGRVEGAGDGTSRESDAKIASSRESDRKIGPSRESDAKIGTSRESDAKIASSRESDRKIGPSRESDAKIGPSRESDRKLA